MRRSQVVLPRFEDLEPRLLLSGSGLLENVIIGDGYANALNYTDTDGTVVSVTLKSGTGNLDFTGDNLEAVPTGNIVSILGSNVELDSIDLAGTTSRGSLTFRTNRDGDGLASVGSITGDTPLARLSAKTIDLIGQGILMTDSGYIGSLYLHDLSQGADIVMDATDVTRGITISAGRLDTGTDIIVGSYLRNLTLTEWVDGSLIAPWAGSIVVKGNRVYNVAGDFGPDVTLTGLDLPANKAILSSARIKGSLTGGLWDIDGNVGSIKAANTDSGWTLDAQGYLKSLYATEGLAGDVSALWIGKVYTKGDLAASVNATGQDARGVSIGTLRAGSVYDVSLSVPGAIRSITATEWVDADGTPDSIEASWLGKLRTIGRKANPRLGLPAISGDFEADVTLSGEGVPTNKYTLAGAYIAGSLIGRVWDIDGNIGSIKAGTTGAGWTLDAEGFVKSAYALDSMQGDISALWFSKVYAKGDLTASISTSGQDAKRVSIGTLQGGSIKDTSVIVPGGIKSIKTSEWIATDGTPDNIDAAWIGKLMTTGRKANPKLGLPAITGDFVGNLTLDNTEEVVQQNLALGSASIAADLVDSTWLINSNAGTVTIKGTSKNSNIIINHRPNVYRGLLAETNEDVSVTISYDELLAATGASDVDADILRFLVESVSSGALTKNGTPVTPGQTLLGPGESLVWSPGSNANGVATAFTIRAWDGFITSRKEVRVTAVVTAANEAPILSAPDPLNGTEEMPGNFENPIAVQEVLAGERTVANAAWWGFDETDSTAALQGAINSRARTVIVPYMGSDWIVGPIRLASNQEIIFEPGVVVTAKQGEFMHKNSSLFSADGKNNISLRGYGATLRMRRDDYLLPPYEPSEWRMGLAFYSSSDIRVEGLVVKDSGGDGIILSALKTGKPCRNVLIKDVIFDNNYRQGMSVISAENLLVENCVFKNTNGIRPSSGIHIEPDVESDKLVNIVIKNSVSLDNAGSGFALYLANLSAKSKDISILFEDCYVRRSGKSGLTVGAVNDNGPKGLIEFKNVTVEDSNSPGAYIFDKSPDRALLRFSNCRWANVAKIETTTYQDNNVSSSPIQFFLRREEFARRFGGVEFVNCSVYDNTNRPFLTATERSKGVHNIEGSINVYNHFGATMDLGVETNTIGLLVKNGYE